jgi:hypothetical protein
VRLSDRALDRVVPERVVAAMSQVPEPARQRVAQVRLSRKSATVASQVNQISADLPGVIAHLRLS